MAAPDAELTAQRLTIVSRPAGCSTEDAKALVAKLQAEMGPEHGFVVLPAGARVELSVVDGVIHARAFRDAESPAA